MNRRMICYLLGRVLFVEALLMLPSVLVGIIYRESATLTFLPSIVMLLAIGAVFGMKKPENTAIFAREGFFVVAAAWILMSVFGAIPFYLSGYFSSFVDCMFEMVSGFTTTGASILNDPGSLPYCILFWRSFSHWVGGMGVLVFVMAVMPLSEERSLHIMRAEVPGPVVGKLVPRMRDTSLILYSVYTVMTLILIVLLIAGGMPVFDSICHAFGAAGTGGFSVKTAGIAYYNSPYIEIVLGIFMLLFGVNFNLYYLILIGRAREAFKSEELRWFIIIALGSTTIIALEIMSIYNNVGGAFREAFFQVSSIMTTTGYATVDFANDWPEFSRQFLLILMVIGASAGSTGGGIKVSRVLILVKTIKQEIKKLLHPRVVSSIRFEGALIDQKLMHSTLAYCAVYFLIVCVSTLLLAINGFDFTTNLAAELSCFNNIGPGIGLVGPMSNFSLYSDFSTVLLTLNMLLGRLEIFPILVLFTPSVWRKRT